MRCCQQLMSSKLDARLEAYESRFFSHCFTVTRRRPSDRVAERYVDDAGWRLRGPGDH